VALRIYPAFKSLAMILALRTSAAVLPALVLILVLSTSSEVLVPCCASTGCSSNDQSIPRRQLSERAVCRDCCCSSPPPPSNHPRLPQANLFPHCSPQMCKDLNKLISLAPDPLACPPPSHERRHYPASSCRFIGCVIAGSALHSRCCRRPRERQVSPCPSRISLRT
jgi:hypothetical protein